MRRLSDCKQDFIYILTVTFRVKPAAFWFIQQAGRH